jgi:hypothetical protein
MTLLKQAVALLVLIGGVAGCRPTVDPSLQPYVGLKKDAARFLSMPFDQQIDTYLKVAALPLKPPDYSLSPLIATSNGDIGQKLAERIARENDPDRTIHLVRLAGDYCALNENCKGEYFLEKAVRAASDRIPAVLRNSYLDENVALVSKGVNRSRGGSSTNSPE